MLKNPLNKEKYKIKEVEKKEEYKDTPNSTKTNTKEVASFISHLFGCTSVIKIMHLQTNSYAKHNALNEVYNTLTEYQDRIAEVYQGYYDVIIDGYDNYDITKYYKMNPVDYIKYVIVYLESSKELFEENDAIINIIDEFIGDLSQERYKLSKLQ